MSTADPAMESTTAVDGATTAVMLREGQRNSTHRVVNAHGRLMYDEIVINDVWINAILSTLALSCATCVCLCFLYCKFQQWKRAAQERRKKKNSRKTDDDSLPSYTIVTGLPSYDEALERMNRLSAASTSAGCIEDGIAGNPDDAAGNPGGKPGKRGKSAAVSVVRVKNELPPPPPPPPSSPPPPPLTPPQPQQPMSKRAANRAARAARAERAARPDGPKYGLVSHTLIVHDNGCSHCLSVQELLETYDVR